MNVALRYLLDTDIVSDLINRGRASAVAAKLDGAGTQVCTSVVVAAKIRYDVARKRSTVLTERAKAVLRTIPVWALGDPVDRRYAEIRANL